MLGITKGWESNVPALSASLGMFCLYPLAWLTAKNPYQDVEKNVEVVGQPEAPETAAAEVVGGEDVHDGQGQEQQHPGEACREKRAGD